MDKREFAMQKMMQDLDKETKKERMAGKVVEQMKTTTKFDEDL